jgi:hypothetical protein
MNAPLVRYDELCRAIADAKTFDDVRDIRDEMEHVKLYGRRVKNRELIAEATELQARASRRLGQLLDEAEKLGWIGRGRPPKADPENVPTPVRFTLEDAGIDRKTSSETRKLSALPAADFERGLGEIRTKIMSGQATIINGARAIMGSRVEPTDSLDHFPTPPWATRALLEHVFEHLRRRNHCKLQFAWEPACGQGHMAEPLKEYFRKVYASDIHPYGYGDSNTDFLTTSLDEAFDWIITNPPFGDLTESFVLKALRDAHVGVAMFVRLQWLETIGRYEAIFRDQPPTLIAFFAERVALHKGQWDPKGGTATAYIWLVWLKGAAPQAPFWIPPGCRERLTRPEDIKRFGKSIAEDDAA